MFDEALIDLGATGMFIDIQFIQLKNIQTHRLPRAIPIYNVDGTPNEAGHITEVVDLVVQHKEHSKQAMFHITSIGKTTIILGHTWLMEHNPKIDWHMGDIAMMRCPASCKLKSTEESDQLSCILANKTQRQPDAHLHW